MPLTRSPKITRGSFPNEHFSAFSKHAIEKKSRIVRGLLNAVRETTSQDVTPYTIRCFGELDFVSHIISICDRLRDDLRAEGTAEEGSMASEHLVNLEIADTYSVRDHLISGFSLAIELAINGDPSGLVDLVETTEVYGRSSNIGVDWKNMVTTAFESRGSDKFRGLANLEEVLETATELVP